MKFQSNCRYFHSKIIICKCPLQNISHFVQASMLFGPQLFLVPHTWAIKNLHSYSCRKFLPTSQQPHNGVAADMCHCMDTNECCHWGSSGNEHDCHLMLEKQHNHWSAYVCTMNEGVMPIDTVYHNKYKTHQGLSQYKYVIVPLKFFYYKNMMVSLRSFNMNPYIWKYAMVTRAPFY